MGLNSNSLRLCQRLSDIGALARGLEHIILTHKMELERKE